MLGIFSVEAQWKDDDELPAKPMLDAVASYPCAEVESHVSKTVSEFQSHLLDWEKKGSEWCFVHLWFHGSPGSVSVESSTINLDDILFAYRSKHENNWENCVMHFGSCATMSADSSNCRNSSMRQSSRPFPDTKSTSVGWGRWHSNPLTCTTSEKN